MCGWIRAEEVLDVARPKKANKSKGKKSKANTKTTSRHFMAVIVGNWDWD